jgi:predicted phosphodiesterase
MENLYKSIYHIFGAIYVPKDLRHSNALVHISDTPSFIYKAIIKMIKKIKPRVIIHTGDIVDDIKLEIRPQLIEVYKKEANKFINEISKYAELIILVPGNHDDFTKLRLKDNVKILNEGDVFIFDGIKLGLSHKYENLPLNCDFYLYGHDKNCLKDYYLNGIKNINVIKDKKIFKLCYPIGTDNYRLKISRMGK